MSTDPYHVVQQEIQSSLQTGSQLLSSYKRIRSTAREDSEELIWARNELKATLTTLDADLEALEESVNVVETTGPRLFGLDESEVAKRRTYVSHVKKEIENMRAELAAHSHPTPPGRQHVDKSSYPLAEMDQGPREDHQAAWAMEEQQMMIREQDRTMESIAGTLSTLAQQAGLMGQELEEHHELLEDLEQNVDRTDSKLNDAMRRMRKFLRDSEEKGSGYCIIVLIIILAVLLLAVILI
ncbi:hypothetical protein M378DRAFT_80101 [Amanita muscaria Koide BX008]|uniref:t-SNARE coiled-coil homology domain-containing protein n=1 Tax=Amanita muscaria (strain Koide BX008) TaxID=946122 RepID=A0A0C2WNF4_AMAMK|nr:hypothetical protein M378DRAFT_80101 [Amanita muscaria Koide BX008]